MAFFSLVDYRLYPASPSSSLIEAPQKNNEKDDSVITDLRALFENFCFQKNADRAFAWTVPAGYDYEKATHENYCGKGTQLGRFAKIRSRCDAVWHGTYTKERQLWQDGVLDEVMPSSKSKSIRPWLVFTCGAMGVGKGYVMNYLAQRNVLPVGDIVRVDPDRFKEMMPEWKGYVARNKKSAGTMCHKESGLLAEMAMELAIESERNVWVDGSLRNFEWHSEKIKTIRKRHPSYRVALFYVHAAEETVRRRVRHRAVNEDRHVPEVVLAASLAAPADTLQALTPLVDVVARVKNECEPVLEAFETVNTSGDWTKIAEIFHQMPTS